ncbi:Spherulation-specific family 4 [Auriculariales sp. MPI-PUGE-AT-0066]|nr:Spherulation-specific family 4 [Auriculariales sp. MPI-PUGE-AT-0066]
MVNALQLLVPLYIYPLECANSRDLCAWKPLYDVIESYPTLQFVVVVNPNSGPGPIGSLPDENYAAAITAVNSYPNVKSIGYIRSTWAARPVGEYQADVDTYAGFAASNYTIEGVFIDEASNDVANLQYYQDFSNYIHDKLPADDTLVVSNQGTVTPQEFFDTMPRDVFVTYEYYTSGQWDEGTIFNTNDPRFTSAPRDRQASIFHSWDSSAPDDSTRLVNLTDYVGEVQKMKYIWVSTTDNYNSFPTNMAQFVSAVNGTNWYMEQHPEWFSRQ